MFQYCPQCKSPDLDFPETRYWICPSCGFKYYHNVAAAVAVILKTDRGICLLERGREPGKGLLDLPGGFVDPGESAEQAAVREVREELGIEAENLVFLTSAPNTYLYKGISYRTCDLFFRGEASFENVKLEIEEVAALHFYPLRQIPLERIAFPSVRTVLQMQNEDSDQ